MRRLTTALALAGLAAATLTACASTVSLSAAPDATNPQCASVIVALPDVLAEGQVGGPLAERPTDAQATAAWGDPTAVTLRCGVPVPDPSTATCLTISGVDWIDVTEEGSTAQTYVTYGRDPAVEVVLDPEVISGGTVLGELGSMVDRTDEVGACISPADAP
ncbi:DUF3515 domain-containing protein [Agrococcus jejuensis]|uniref:DUF3515 domain-containing protein n=1 Tax=Agrococcus jejuensis TaxID=399736 RepID=A0A1G8B3J0_9MICO|nr:DUF3515 domain-containing protein [Agrococcus jejuensis]SDH27200.1 Protein of unknown function [Agrococcus jejuensis]